MSDFRIERDTMGEMRVPSGALYGAQTQRAVENFPISRLRFTRPFIKALGTIKAAAAHANAALEALDPAIAAAIEEAATAVAHGDHDQHFVVDIFQTGSGTSTNMNANEVIAHLASRPGAPVHPNDHVNRCQSSNDVIPTAIHLAAADLCHNLLLPAMGTLYAALDRKSREFHDIVKIGRTHLQDAVPMRLGQELGGYARQVQAAAERLRAALNGIFELPLGGTAVGTGLNAVPGFAQLAVETLAHRTGLPFRRARNPFEAQGARDAVAFLSAALRGYAVALSKIGNDIRWLASGPRCGLGELRLPATQPGSSIMPGKVNPVIIESLLMACAQVIGHDAAIAWCCGPAGGAFELNTTMPLMAYNLGESIELLAAVSRNFELRSVEGMEADAERAGSLVERSLAMATALAPEIGYERAAALVKEAYATGRTVREVAREKSGLDEFRLNALLDPETQAGA
jgi:fumarate hydratase, class II